MFRREDWMAGRKPAKIPTPTDTAKASSHVCGVTLKFTSQIETDVLFPTATNSGMKTNLARSTPRIPPIRDIRTYARGPNGLVGTIQRTFADGRSQQIEYIAEYDRVYPVTGTDEYDHLLLKRVDDFTAEAVLSHADRVYGTARRRISPDGKTMTITFDRKSSETPVHNVAVYDKVGN